MKKTAYLFILLSITLFSFDMKITDNLFDNGQFVDFCKYKDEVFILSKSIYDKPAVIYHFNDNSWNKINLQINDEFIELHSSSRIRVDSNSNIWISSNGMYKYANGSWSKYFVDNNETEERYYTQFIVDKDNNLWIMSGVNNHDDKIFSSELLKYNHNEFDTVFSFKTAASFFERNGFSKTKTLSYTDYDKIIFQRTFGATQEGLTKDSSFADIYIVNLDKTYKRIKSDNALSLELDSWVDMNQNITHLYSKFRDEIWVLLSQRMFQLDLNDPKTIIYLGSGISLYKDNEWILFNESNNLTKISKYNYDDMGQILDLHNGKYLIFGRKNCYSLNYNSVQLEKLEWSNILDGSKYSKFNKIIEDEKIIKKYHTLSIGENNLLGFHDSFILNNEIWMLFPWGLLQIPLDSFTDVTEFINEEFLIYPNPADNYIYISGIDNSLNTKIQIFNSIGSLVLSEDLVKSEKVDISGLLSGLYFIKYNNSVKQIIINR